MVEIQIDMTRLRIFVFLLIVLIPGIMEGQEQLTLEVLRQKALANNKNLAMAGKMEEAARQMKKAAFTQFLPSLSATGSYTRNEKNLKLLAEDALLPVGSRMADGSFGFTADQVSNKWSMVNGKPVPLDETGVPFNPSLHPEKIQWKGYALLPEESLEYDLHNLWIGGVSLLQPLSMGGKIRELYKIAGYTEGLSEAQKESTVQEVLIGVDEAYWRVISLINKANLAREYRNLILKLDSNVQLMVEEGVATRADALRVKVKLNEAEMSLTRVTNGVDLSRMALNQLCGLPVNDKSELAGQELQQKEEPVPVVSLETAWNNRPEIKALLLGENMARSNEHLARSRFLPNIALSGNYLYSNPNLYNGFQNKFDGMFSLGVVATIPLFHFGERWHTLKAARLLRDNATLRLEDAREKIELQIDQDSFRVAESLKKEVAAGSQVNLAGENLHTATEGFSEGMIPLTDLMAAQTAWLSASSDHIDAVIEVRLCKRYLKKSLGIMELPVEKQK